MAFFFVGRGFHVATGAYALLAFLALRRQGFSWGWLVAVLLLAAGLLGDLLMLAYGVVPLVVAGLVSALGERRWRAGLTPLTAAAGGVAVFGFARLVALALGTYSESSGLRIANFHQIVTNMGHLPLYLVSLLGLSDEVMASGGVPAPFSQIRGLGIVTAAAALFVLACFVLAFVKLVATTAAGRATADDRAGEQETRRLDDLLVVAVICSPAPFVLLAGARGAGVRYLTVTVVFAVVLAGRVVARALSGLRRGWPVALATGAGAALALALGASYGLAMSGPRYIDPATTLATWLEAHDLHKGLGGYWDASITTVQSGGAVVVRPVRQLGDGPVEKAALSRSDWYKGNDSSSSSTVHPAAMRAFVARAHLGEGPSTSLWSGPTGSSCGATTSAWHGAVRRAANGRDRLRSRASVPRLPGRQAPIALWQKESDEASRGPRPSARRTPGRGTGHPAPAEPRRGSRPRGRARLVGRPGHRRTG